MRKFRKMPSTIMMQIALELRKLRWSEEAIRSTLRGMVLSCGDIPTCSTVEEVIRAVRHEPVYSYKCIWCGQVYSEKEAAAVCCCDVMEGWECLVCGAFHSEADEARQCCKAGLKTAAAAK